MEEIISEGKCIFCDKLFKKAGIHRHLVKHLSEKEEQDIADKSYHLKVEMDSRWGSSGYFLALLMDRDATMENLDNFLRAIWLECCGHMSSFSNPVKRKRTGMFDYMEAQKLLEQGKEREYEALMEDVNGEIPMSRTAGDALRKGLKLEYQYDFGSTTALSITVMNEYDVKAAEPIKLLSRNEPLNLMCDKCEKEPATVMCTECEYELFCDNCASKHAKECEDYGAVSIVNSPRMGVCGYEGGRIDLERDGVYKRTE